MKKNILKSFGIILIAVTFISVFGLLRTERAEAYQTETQLMQSDNAQTIYRYLVNEIGLSSAGACGLMANMYCESGFNPHSGYPNYSYGICAWTGSLLNTMKSWCGKNDCSWQSLSGQLAFLKYELSLSSHAYVTNYLMSVQNNAQGAYDAAYYFCYNYERPANKASRSAYRGSMASAKLWPLYSKITVSFDANGGKVSETSKTISLGSKYGSLPVPTRKGYVFKGWSLTSDGEEIVTEKSDCGMDCSHKLYAIWTKESYQISYKLFGGSLKTGKVKYTVTSEFALETPVRSGYTFKGWYLTKNYSKKVTSIAKGTTGNLTLYAKWDKNTYFITYVLNGGTFEGVINPESYTISDSVTFSPASREGHTFLGWYVDAALTKPYSGIVKGSTGHVTVYAKWSDTASFCVLTSYTSAK